MRQWSDCHQAVDQKDVLRFQHNHERLQEAVRSPRLSFFITLCVQPLESPAEGFGKSDLQNASSVRPLLTLLAVTHGTQLPLSHFLFAFMTVPPSGTPFLPSIHRDF